MNNIIIDARQLSFAYHALSENAGEELPILDNIDFSMRGGEISALVGASGSGKSSFLHILGLMESHFSGQLLLLGYDVGAISESQRDIVRGQYIGFVFQSHYLVNECSALDNVAMSLIVKDIPPKIAREKAFIWLERVGLSARAHHYPYQLSGGERQRVAIARALIHQPQLLLADEPTGNLDPKTAGAIFETLLECSHNQGVCTLIVTHDHHKANQCHKKYHILDKKIVNL